MTKQGVSFFILGIFALLATHLLFLGQIPGLHFDEAWSANYAYRIAFEPHFWPWQGMSPYTLPWTQYCAAFFFRVFGTNIFIFRLSQMSLVFGGYVFLALALRRLKENTALQYLPWVLAFTTSLLLNHRFAIEMNTFHVLCFGALCFAVTSERYWLLALSVILGVSSHILFLAPCLAILVVGLIYNAERMRSMASVILLICLLLLPFFLWLTFQLPTPTKGFALLALLALIFLYFALQLSIPPNYPKLIRSWGNKLWLLTLPFLFNLLFFYEGHWSYAISHGFISFRLFEGVTLLWLFVIWAKYYSEMKQGLVQTVPGKYIFIFFTSCLFAGLMMLKPTPRYFEIPLLLLVLLTTMCLARLPKRFAALALSLFCIVQTLDIYANYYLPWEQGKSHEADLHFLTFKDSSRDFLTKQKLVQFLSQSGCGLADIRSADSRLLGALRFLAHGDWPHTGNCKWKKLRIERAGTLPSDARLVTRVHGFELFEQVE